MSLLMRILLVSEVEEVSLILMQRTPVRRVGYWNLRGRIKYLQ